MAEIYEDDRLTQVEEEKAGALQDVKDTFSGMAEQAGQIYDKQAEAVQNYADQQAKLQQEQTDFTIEQIEQQKEQAQKDYTKEQSAAYTDYQKQTAKHGVQAEQMAAGGMTGTGYSESSRVSMYNAYQQRVAVARESFNQLVMNYNNGIKEAQLQNSSALAEIAFNALVKGLEISAQSLQYGQQLAMQELGMKQDVENMYHGRYMDVLGQINTEKAQAEQIRQFELNHQLDVEAQAEQIRQFDMNYQLDVEALAEDKRQSDREYEYRVGRDAVADAQWQAKYDLENRQLAQSQKLEAAGVLAMAGDFSGYKDALGLTDAQVKKLEEKYKNEIKTEADEKAYQKEQEKAAILAAAGDFSGYQKMYDLTDTQVKQLETAYGVEKKEEEKKNTKELTGTDRANWENRFARAGDAQEIEAVVEEMLGLGYDEDAVWELYWAFTPQSWQSGNVKFKT